MAVRWQSGGGLPLSLPWVPTPVRFWFAVKFQHVRCFAPAIALQGSILLRKGVLRTRWGAKN